MHTDNRELSWIVNSGIDKLNYFSKGVAVEIVEIVSIIK